METNINIPVLDSAILQERTNEFAMKGAIKCIEDYYNGYDSPFKNALKKHMNEKEISPCFDLPDIIATINDSLRNEIDKIANAAVAKTFIPLVANLLTREEKEIKFSDILKKFISIHSMDGESDFSLSLEENQNHRWLEMTIKSAENRYELTLHTDYKTEKEKEVKYQILTLPRDTSRSRQLMKLTIGGSELEMPFTKDVLQDEFTAYIARLVISNSIITMDYKDFQDDMFEDDCRCH